VLCQKVILPENRTLAFSTLLILGPISGTDWGSAEFSFGIRRVLFLQLQSYMLSFGGVPFRRADTQSYKMVVFEFECSF